MDRNIFEAEHDACRQSVRTYFEKKVVPHHDDRDRDGIVPRELFTQVAELGAFAAVPEEYGGSGIFDFRYNAVFVEEAAALGIGPALLGPALQTDVCMPYLIHLTNEEQKQRWLGGVAPGEKIVAIAMTEPGTGSDLSGIRMRAVRDGDDYVINGSKTFITNGINADLVITAVRTGDDPHCGISIVVETDTPGFERGRNLDKVGQHVARHSGTLLQRRPRTGGEPSRRTGKGFYALTNNLPQERLSLAVAAVASARAALDWTIEYVRQRRAFGQAIGEFQATRFRLANLVSEVEITQTYVDRATSNSMPARSASSTRASSCTGIRLHARVPDRTRVRRCSRHPHLRRYH